MDVSFLWLRWLFLVKFVVLRVVDGVTVDWFVGWLIEVICLEKVTEVEVRVLVIDINKVILILRNVWEVGWGSIINWLCYERLWSAEINLGSTCVVKVVIPVPWSGLPVVVNCPWIVMVGWLSFISVFNVDSTYYCQYQVRCEGFHSRYREVITSEIR